MEQTINNLRNYLAAEFASVRVSAIQSSDQLLKEIQSINTAKLPGVIIIFDNLLFQSSDAVKELQLTLVLVDRFSAGSEEKAMSLYQSGEKLLNLFPCDGIVLGNSYIIPTDMMTATPDRQYAAFALGITCKKSY